jgi:hypothetical protein
MSHVGIALDHPLNAAIIGRLTQRPSASERAAAIARFERVVQTSPSATLAKALQRLKDNRPDPPRTPSQSAEGVSMMALGARPDIVERLWKLGLALPVDCRWVAYQSAVLAHSQTGIIFGLAIGTFGVALRLPETIAVAAAAQGAMQTIAYKTGLTTTKTISARAYGADFWFCPDRTETAVWARAAFDHFGRM